MSIVYTCTGTKMPKGGKRPADAPPNSNINTKFTKIDDEISFGDFFNDKLHVPTSNFVGPRTGETNLNNNKPVDETDRIARDHDRHYAEGGIEHKQIKNL